MILYTIMGGLVAVAYTDFIQTIVMLIAVGILYGLKLSKMLPEWIEPIIISIFLSLILMVVVSLATFKPEKAT
ncbi:MAG: hypothetical protein JSV31_09465, partial [Desulfobacterales bacterium]